jgi:glycosyltransferase involved in cell wall biosynthesis
MRILFLYDPVYSVGGVQTFLLRAIPRLVEEGHEVALLTRPMLYPHDTTTEFVDGIAKHAKVYVGEHRYMVGSAGQLERLDMPVPDVMAPCNLPSFLLALFLQGRCYPAARVVAGVFHPREYCWGGSRLGFDGRLVRAALRQLPPENIYFITEGTAAQTGRCSGRDFSGSPVLPLAIETGAGVHVERRPRHGKIVSITRLTPYYPVHVHLIGAVAELRRRGVDVEYHAYGAGERHAALVELARRRGVSDAVYFHGAVEYSRLNDVLEDAFVYVGLGTSLIEAAVRGVPAIVAVDQSSEPVAFGFLSETQDNELGGHLSQALQVPLVDCLARVLDMNQAAYDALAERCRRRAGDFSADRLGQRLGAILAGAQPFAFQVGRRERILGWLDWILWRVLNKVGFHDTQGQRYLRA